MCLILAKNVLDSNRLTRLGERRKFRAMIRWLVTLIMALSALSPGASEPRPATKTLLVLGDSIAAGYGVEEEEAFPTVLQRKIDAAGLRLKVVNAGLSGDTTAGGLRRINWLLRQQVDFLLVELGGNDGLRGIMPEETRKNLEGIIQKVKEKYPRAKIIVAGMQMPENMGEEYTQKYRDIFPEVAKSKGAVLIPFLLDGVGGKAELNQPDRIHPTAEGHEIVAETVWKVIEPVLKGEK
jgi:acyl-CoA thioesterase I